MINSGNNTTDNQRRQSKDTPNTRWARQHQPRESNRCPTDNLPGKPTWPPVVYLKCACADKPRLLDLGILKCKTEHTTFLFETLHRFLAGPRINVLTDACLPLQPHLEKLYHILETNREHHCGSRIIAPTDAHILFSGTHCDYVRLHGKEELGCIWNSGC